MRYQLVVLYRGGRTQERNFRTIKDAKNYASDVKHAISSGRLTRPINITMMYIVDKDGSLRYKWELQTTFKQTYPMTYP